jgi:hypothetical protein
MRQSGYQIHREAVPGEIHYAALYEKLEEWKSQIVTSKNDNMGFRKEICFHQIAHSTKDSKKSEIHFFLFTLVLA